MSHPGVSCDACGHPVVGVRWKCAHSAESYDLCSQCHASAVGRVPPDRAFLRLAVPLSEVAGSLWRPSPPYSYARSAVETPGAPGGSAAAVVPAPGATCAACGEGLFRSGGAGSGGASAEGCALTSALRHTGPWACGACVASGAAVARGLFDPREPLLEVGAPVIVLDHGSPDVVPAASSGSGGGVGSTVPCSLDPTAQPHKLAVLSQGDAAGATPEALATAVFGGPECVPRGVHTGVACDVCGVHPLVGPRLVRVDAENYDLCWGCFVQGPGEGRPPATATFVLLSRWVAIQGSRYADWCFCGV
jgi:hypothetical protein